MSLVDNNKAQPNTQRAPQAGLQDPGIPGYSQKPASSGGAISLQSFFNAGVGREHNSGLATIITDHLRELISALDTALPFKLDVLPAISSSLGTVGIDAVIVSTRTNNGAAVSFVFAIEESAAPLKPFEISRGSIAPPLRVERTTSHHINDRSRDIWKALTKQQYGNVNHVIEAGALVLPTEINEYIAGTDTKQREHTINNLLRIALNAVGFRTEEANGGTPRILTAEQLRSFDPSYSPELDLTYTNRPQTITTSLGLQRRSSFQLSVSLRPKNNTNKDDGVILENEVIAFGDGFIDLAYSEELETRVPAVTQRYIPEVILTGLDSPLPFITPQIQLFGLIAAAAWGKDNNWVTYFQEQQLQHDYGSGKKSGNKLSRAIAAVGYECTHLQGVAPEQRTPQYLSVNATTNPDEVANLILAAIDGTQLKISIDVSLVEDEQAWLNQLILGAAQNLVQKRVNDEGAYRAFYEWCDRSTNGFFKNHFTFGDPVAYDKNTLIPNGYFESEGKRYDAREVDYLTLLNAHGKTGEYTRVLDQYSRIQGQYEANEYERLEAFTKGILDNYKGLVIKGVYRRVQLESNFIRALIAAFKDAGLTFSLSQTGHTGTGGIRRHYSGIGGGLSTAGLFNTAHNYTGPNASGNLVPTSWSSLV